jgi:hypothetical protein
MPDGFNILSARVQRSSLEDMGSGPQRADAVLLIATTEPAKPLVSEVESKNWLDAAAQVCAQRVGFLPAAVATLLGTHRRHLPVFEGAFCVRGVTHHVATHDSYLRN